MGKPGLFKDRLCGVVAAPTAGEMVRLLRRALRVTRTVELRLDYLKDHRELGELLKWLAAHRPGCALRKRMHVFTPGRLRQLLSPQKVAVQERMSVPPWLRRAMAFGADLGSPPRRASAHPVRAILIGTYRRMEAGGRLRDAKFQFPILMVAAAAGCDWLDLEIEAAQALPADPLTPVGAPRFIISRHDFRRTPGNLSALLRRLERSGAHAVKIATQCHSIRDSLRVLRLGRNRRNVIAVPMGEAGLPARVLALRHGSALAYAAVGEKTAPGQLTLEEMRHLYRADRLDRRTRVYGLVGDPVAHSLSPVLHNSGFIARRINAVYLPFRVKELRDFLAAIEPLGIAGFSVTLPHKVAILRHLDDCDPLAARIGAVNTVVVRGPGQLYGYNTDYVGVLRALDRRVALRGSRVLVYGAGGAARAVAFALAQGGAVVAVCARRMEQAERLARAVGGEAIARPRLRREFFDALVQCTPVGMHPGAAVSPLRAEELNCRVVMDLIYRPRKTRLLELAERRGIATVSGVEMFVAQGAAQWQIWTGLRAPEARMRAAVIAALKRQG